MDQHTPQARSRGSNGLEYVAMFLVAALLVGGIAVAVNNVGLGDIVTRAICQIMGGQNCGVSKSSTLSPRDYALAGRYVSVGDSYIAGEGAGDYSEDSNNKQNACHRSKKAFSEGLSSDNPFAGGFTNVACSGAVIDDLTTPNTSRKGEKAQFDALGPDVSFVTVSIGGNDAKFADIVKACLDPRSSCQDDQQKVFDEATKGLEERLAAQYEEIKNRTRKPNGDVARVTVMGYPHLFPAEPKDWSALGITTLTADEQRWMNKLSDAMNAIIQRAAKSANVTYVDVRSAYAGHECGTEDPWINSVSISGPGTYGDLVQESFHPNADGQAAEKKLVQEEMDHPK